jgi:hypothetical protein
MDHTAASAAAAELRHAIVVVLLRGRGGASSKHLVMDFVVNALSYDRSRVFLVDGFSLRVLLE